MFLLLRYFYINSELYLDEILCFCDRAYVTVTAFWSYTTPSEKYTHKWNCVEFSWGQTVYSSSAVGLRPSVLEHNRCSTTGRLCLLCGGIRFNHYNCRIQNSKIYRALSILSLKPKFTPCLRGIVRLVFLCSWMPSFMILHINKYIYTYIPLIKRLVKISIGFQMSYTIQNAHK